MSKVLQERGFGSLPSSTKTNPWDQVKSISTAKADFSEIRHIECSPYAISSTHHRSLFFETVPFPRRLQNFSSLVDLGASVSVMPFSTYTSLGLGALSHTRLTIELADRTIKQPRGFTMIDDDDMTNDVVLDMKFCKKYASCQKVMKKFALGDMSERIMKEE
ncbi:hypothetical protein Tco_0013414 [Tanacetum coccineum]